MRFRLPIGFYFALTACAALLVAVAPCAMARPAKVILLRHAEKPDNENNPNLSERGRNRANALVGFFANELGIDTNNPPAALFATRPVRGSRSLRSQQTLLPLSRALTITIRQPEGADRYDRLAAHLLTNPEFDGKTVVVCWVHDELGPLARALGAEPKPKDWKSSSYDRVWSLNFKKKEVRCKTVLQELLPGDEAAEGLRRSSQKPISFPSRASPSLQEF